MQENAMCFDEVQDVTIFMKRKKTLLASFSVLNKVVFKIDGFLGLWQDVAGKFFAAIVEKIVLTSKSSQEGLDSQWEGW